MSLSLNVIINRANRFSGHMLGNLAKPRNMVKGDWRTAGEHDLLAKLLVEVAELVEAMGEVSTKEQAGRVVSEAADVANFAMMIADQAEGVEDEVPVFDDWEFKP